MEEAPIADAVAWLAGATGVPLRILDDNKGQSGIDLSVEITLDVRGMPALTVLEIMMEQYEDDTGEACDWQLRTGCVEGRQKTAWPARVRSDSNTIPSKISSPTCPTSTMVRGSILEPPLAKAVNRVEATDRSRCSKVARKIQTSRRPPRKPNKSSN